VFKSKSYISSFIASNITYCSIAAMATLLETTQKTSDSPAVIIPHRPNALTLSYTQLSQQLQQFQHKLASIGIGTESAVSIALPNTLEFIIAFLATSYQRAIAAPLNPAYKQDEFEFYIDDLKSALAIVPRGAVGQDAPVVRAARKFEAAIAECWWDDALGEVVLDVKELGKLKDKRGAALAKAHPDDVALVLHTSGTTGRPKAASLSHAIFSSKY
jgi:acyl-CoA synthetase (AMP-forming)/AMP-acid ligase II